MTNAPLSVAVFGATGLVGEAVLQSLGDAALPVAVHALGGVGRSPRVDSASLGARPIPVYPASHFPELSLDVAVLCLPGKAAALLGPALVKRGVFVVDAADAAGLQAPVWAPDGALPDAALRAGAVRLPGGAGGVLAQVVAPLVTAGATGVSATVMLPAGRAGRAAVEELGQQVLASFTGQDPPRKHFVDGLAFDVLAESADACDEDGWSPAERRMQEQVATACALALDDVTVNVVTLPMFTGLSATLHVRGLSLDAASAALTGAKGLLHAPRAAELRPRACEADDARVRWGRLREDAVDGVHLQIAAEPLALVGAMVVDALERIAAAGVGRSRA